jgi:N6-adenosine-specific RNA methylase IME4
MYDITYTDPPWPQRKGGKKLVRPNSSGMELNYATMTLESIRNIHRIYFEQVNERHNVFIWTIDKFLFETERMMTELGYRVHARIIWDKVTGIPAAFTVRFAHEYLLWCYKPGKMLKPTDSMRGKYSTVLREQVTAHSRKPECAYEMIENMFPNAKKLEMFARNYRGGWDAMGNELPRRTTDITEQEIARAE